MNKLTPKLYIILREGKFAHNKKKIKMEEKISERYFQPIYKTKSALLARERLK